MTELGGYLPLGAILANVAGYFRHGVDTQPGWKAHAVSAVNRALEMAADLRDWPELLKNSELRLMVQGDADSDTLQAGSAFFPAPWGSRRIDSITMMSPSRYVMSGVARDAMLNMMTTMSDTASGAPEYYAEWGTTAQHAALAAEGTLTVKSDSALNNSTAANKRVVVTYRQAGHHLGEARQVNVEGAFDSGVDLPVDAVAGWPIESIQVPSGWAGTLTVEDASANVIVDVPKSLLPDSAASGAHATYRRKLYRMEKASDVDRGGNMAWLANPRRLIADTDVPDIPCANYLIEMAASLLFKARGNIVASRSHAADAEDALEGRAAREVGKHGVAGPRHGNVLGMTGMPPC